MQQHEEEYLRVVGSDDAGTDPDQIRLAVIRHNDIVSMLSISEEWESRHRGWNPNIMNKLRAIDYQSSENFEERQSVFHKLKVRMIDPLAPRTNITLRYDALSYSWHNSGWTTTPELGATGDPSSTQRSNAGSRRVACPISPHLWKVLLAESASAKNLFWVDQVCINQNDEAEKNVSIAFTDRVYQNAERVFLAIEDVALPPSIIPSLQAILRTDAIDQQTVSTLSPEILSHVLEFCIVLFSARLFARSWCWHEFSCSDRHVVFIPLKRESEDSKPRFLRFDLSGLPKILTTASYHLRDASGEQMQLIIPYADSIKKSIRIGTKLVKGQTNPTFVEAYRNVFSGRAKHKKDQLSIVLNGCASGLYYTGAALDSDEACCRLIHRIAFAAGDASIIGVDGKPTTSRAGAPSTWCLEPTADEARAHYYAQKTTPTEFNVQISDREGLIIDVVVLDSAAAVRNPEANLMQVASTFMAFDFSKVSNMEPFIYNSDSYLGVTDEEQEEFRRRFIHQKEFYAQALACILGYDVASFFTLLDSSNIPGSSLVKQHEKHSVSRILECLQGYSSSPDSLDANTTEFASNLDLAVFAQFLTAFVRRVLDVKGMYNLERPATWNSYRVGLLSSSMMSQSPVPIVVPTLDPLSIITVPADVLGSEYSMLRRVWILHRIEGAEHSPNSQLPHEEAGPRRYALTYKTMLVGSQSLSRMTQMQVEII